MKKFVALLLALVMGACLLTGCSRESDMVSYNIGKEADNFNVTRRLTVINARTDTILLQLEGTFSLSNNSTNELEIICEVGEGVYQKHFVYLTTRFMWLKIFLVPGLISTIMKSISYLSTGSTLHTMIKGGLRHGNSIDCNSDFYHRTYLWCSAACGSSRPCSA